MAIFNFVDDKLGTDELRYVERYKKQVHKNMKAIIKRSIRVRLDNRSRDIQEYINKTKKAWFFVL